MKEPRVGEGHGRTAGEHGRQGELSVSELERGAVAVGADRAQALPCLAERHAEHGRRPRAPEEGGHLGSVLLAR